MKGIVHPIREIRSAPTVGFAAQLRIFLGLLVVVSGIMLCPRIALGQEDEYVKIYAAIQEADSLSESKQSDAAVAKYREAQDALRSFQLRFPNWNKNVVNFRINYVAQKIGALTAKPLAPPPPTTPTSTGTSGARSRGTAAAPTLTTARVKLLDAGAEPRKELRLHPKVGDKQDVTLTMRIGMDMKMGDQGQAAKSPAITMSLNVSVKNVSADGDITYDIVMGDTTITEEPGTSPEMAAAMKSSVGSLNKVTGTRTVTGRGLNKATNFKFPAGSGQEVRQAMELLKESFSDYGIVLPEEPVGPGARWEVIMPVESVGLPIAQTATYQLTAIEGDRITAKTTVTQSASNQKSQSSSTPGTQMDLGKMSGRGTGETTCDLTQVLPSKAMFDLHAELSSGTPAGAQNQSFTMKIDVKLEVTSK